MPVAHGGTRAATQPTPWIAGGEVADLNPGRLPASGTGGECASEIAGHEVVAERGQQHTARVLRPPTVLAEHSADEPCLAGGIEIVRPGGHGGLQRRFAVAVERPHGGDQHVAVLDQGTDTVGLGHVRGRRVQPTVPLREFAQPLLAAPRQHRSKAASGQRCHHQPARVASGAKDHDLPHAAPSWSPMAPAILKRRSHPASPELCKCARSWLRKVEQVTSR
jgi:hypothetical protein